LNIDLNEQTSRLAVMKYNISQKLDHVTDASLPLAMTSLLDNSTFNAADGDNIYHNVTESIAAVLNATEVVPMNNYETSTTVNIVNRDPSDCYQVLVDCNSSGDNIYRTNQLRAPSTPIITVEIVRMKRQLNQSGQVSRRLRLQNSLVEF